MSRQSEVLRRLRQLPADRREEFLAQLGGVTRGARSAPLSFRQEQLWLFDRVAPSGTAYGLGFAVTLTGPLDLAALQRAVEDLVERHVILRSVFPHEHDTGAQVVQPPHPVQLVAEECEATDPRRLCEQTVRAELRRGFDVSAEPLTRFRLLRVSDVGHVLVVVTHYLAMDPRSISVLCRDLATAYASRQVGKPPEFPQAAPQFGDYASWQREWSGGPEAERAGEYWQRALAGWENTELPTDFPRPRLLNLTSGTVEHPIAAPVVQQLRGLAEQLGVPAEDVLLAVFFSLVARHTAGTDLIIGLPRQVSGPFGLETLVGDCGNLLPIRVEVDTGTSFAELVRSVHQRRTEAEQHAALPFKVVLDRLRIEPDPGRLPLVQLGFDTPVPATAPSQAGDVQLTAEQVDTGVGTFELAVQATLATAEPTIAVRYVTALYQQRTAARLARRYLRLLEAGCAAPDARLSDLPFADEDERASVMQVWNQPIGTFPDGTIHERFERIARDNGGRVALAWREGEMTYADLEARANRIAHALLRQQAEPGSPVPVLLERGPAMIASILGVLKAGAGYVPIDLSQPAERVAAIVEDCGARLALSSSAARHLLGDQLQVVDVDADLTGLPDTPPGAPCFPESLAYVIYTSGSTGRPKGVLIEHRNVTNFFRTVQQMFRLEPDDRLLQFASPGFDVSTFEIFGGLLSGARLYLVDEDERRSIEALDAVMADQRITVIDLPPAIMELLHPERYPDLRVSFVGGEAFSGELTTRWARHSAFYNGYGPTETTVTVVAKQCEGQWNASPPIGRAMANHRAYVLDADLGLLPPGATGELAIAGLGVGRGYLGRPDLTAERLRPDPYGPPGSRMYLTGDLAVWDDEGDLGFLGRADRQVKVRGVRIELGEVEAALQAVAGVARAIANVAVDPHRGPVLVAYVLPDDGAELQLDAVRGALGTRLPPTMVPSVLVPLREVPLTQSGKVDRRALPAVEFAEVEELTDSEDATSTPTERKVRGEVFAPLLGMRIANQTNFFAAGGTSLQAIRIASQVKTVFGVEVPIADFFAAPTVVGLAHLVDQAIERDRGRRDTLSEALELVEGRSDEEIAELAKLLGGPRPDS